MTDEGLNDPKLIAEAWDPLHPYQQYLARALIDDSAAAAQIFDEMVTMTEQLLRQIDKQRPDPSSADLRTRAAVTVAMALGIPAFQAHISRSIGTDILSPGGGRRVILAMLDIQSHPTISPDSARTLRQGLDKSDTPTSTSPAGTDPARHDPPLRGGATNPVRPPPPLTPTEP